jgi:hypothetical protein
VWCWSRLHRRPRVGITAEAREAISHAYDDEQAIGMTIDEVLTDGGLSGERRAQVLSDSSVAEQ